MLCADVFHQTSHLVSLRHRFTEFDKELYRKKKHVASVGGSNRACRHQCLSLLNIQISNVLLSIAVVIKRLRWSRDRRSMTFRYSVFNRSSSPTLQGMFIARLLSIPLRLTSVTTLNFLRKRRMEVGDRQIKLPQRRWVIGEQLTNYLKSNLMASPPA